MECARGNNGNTDFGVSVQFCGVISDRNGRTKIQARRPEKILRS